MIKMELGRGGFQPLEKIRDILKDYIRSGRFIREAGQTAVKLIRERTKKGVDASGLPFAPYSPEYRKTKGVRTVDLSSSGQMLNDLTFEVRSPTQGAVTIRGFRAKLAADHVKGTGVLPRRDFISIKPGGTEEQKLIKSMREKLERELKRALR